MRMVFIVNPAAGHGRAGRLWRRLAVQNAPGARVVFTNGRGDASRLTAEALASGDKVIVAVGGDGTLAEALNGWFRAPTLQRDGLGAALATLPAGSGCDTARHFGVFGAPKSLAGAMKTVSSWKIRRLDIGRAEVTGPGGAQIKRYFLNIAAFGLAGDVALRTQDGGKALGGTLGYMLASLRALATAAPKPMTLLADGETVPGRAYHLVAVANTAFTGGGMHIAPGADAQDGLLDMVTVGALSRLELLRRFPGLYRGKHLGAPGIERRLVRRLEASSESEAWVNIDGEAVGHLPARFEVLPRAIPFLTP